MKQHKQTIKRFLSGLLTAALIPALAVPAMAAEEAQFDFQSYTFDTRGYLASGEDVNVRFTFEAAAPGYEFTFYSVFNVLPIFDDDGEPTEEYYYMYGSGVVSTYPVVVLKDDSHVEMELLDEDGTPYPPDSPLASVYACSHGEFNEEDNTLVLNPYLGEDFIHVPDVTSGSVNDFVIRLEDNTATATELENISGEGGDYTYFIRSSDAALFQVTPQGVPAPNRTALPSTQTVTVDGVPVEFQMYALRSSGGALTNYINLRDLALALNGTEAQFQVGWEDGDITLEPGTAYTPNGSENATPFSGPRGYEFPYGGMRVGEDYVSAGKILLKDDQGGGYTYFKLRDLGKVLNFNVTWSADSGVSIDTTQPYSGDN